VKETKELVLLTWTYLASVPIRALVGLLLKGIGMKMILAQVFWKIRGGMLAT
jgi:hypothetical protein